uniref:FHA domain-containing protein n=1 Tax=Pseudo-nitzschia delicatissima TaxID=44447 RepID=A0A7S0XPU1_9STRA|mmetsp:Transcript_1308/g.3000  ORF Transcript_1308/g.3000 Transcript_1308/m.3000 type:complete len:472 (+) Transcript_1308:162-1577(+)
MADVTDDEGSKGAAAKPPSNPDQPPADESDPQSKDTPAAASPVAIDDMAFGGKRPQESFALLDGFNMNSKERMTIDITRFPAVLGRSNESDKKNPFFFSLGSKKVFSRRHMSIYYRDKEGGRVVWDEDKQTTIYKDAKTVIKEEGPQSLPKANNKNGLPSKGFFVIESLGKNRILVDKRALYQGESMVLHSGSVMRISNYFYVFLLPTDAEPKPHTIEGEGETKKKKTTKTKKRPAPTTSSSSAAATKKTKTSKTNTATATLAELETLPVEELLEKMDEAVSKGLWDRKNQFIGATICYHAVRSAGKSSEIQQKVIDDGGVSRSDIMDWIHHSDKFGGWVQQMLTNMEPRSYQAAITKSLLKSGFARTSGAGRYIKWELPSDIPLTAKKKMKPKPTIKQEAVSEKEDKEEAPKEEEQEEDDNEASSAGAEEEEEGGSDANENEDAENPSQEPAPEENAQANASVTDMDIIV